MFAIVFTVAQPLYLLNSSREHLLITYTLKRFIYMTEGESGQETQSENLPSADGHKGQGHIGPSQKNGSSSGWVSV